MAVFELEESSAPDPASGSGERKKFEPIEEDTTLDAVLAEVEVRGHPFFKDDEGNPEIKVNFEFHFELDGQKRKMWGETPTTFTTHPDCKLRNWVQQILGGGELPAGFRLNTENLRGTPVRIVIHYETWKDKKTGEDRWKNEVKDIMHAKTASVGSSLLAGEEPF